MVLAKLEETPLARYEDFQLPSVSMEQFNHIKRDLRARTLDALWQRYYNYYNDQGLPENLSPPKDQRMQAQNLANKYILLKTGLTPDKIDDNIISDQLGKRLYKFTYG
jgi:hypothetical protein